MIQSSGVIASFNQADYLLESVLSLASEVEELIVVDDGSTDASPQILRGGVPNNVRVIFNSQTFGVSTSLNRAIHEARGEYIFLQGGDDICVSGRVQKQISLLEQSTAVFTYSLPQVIGSDGTQLADDIAPEFFREVSSSAEEQINSLLFEGNFICAPSAAFKKEFFDKSHCFNTNLLFLQDFDLWLSMLNFGRSIRSNERFVNYRKHGSNLSKEGSQDKGFSKFRFSTEYEFCVEKATTNFGDATLIKLLKLRDIEPSTNAEINRVLLLLSHTNNGVKQSGLRHLLQLQAVPEYRSELAERGLDEPGFQLLLNQNFTAQS